MSKQKIGRNSKCPCGSGKKFKNCCLNNISNSYAGSFLDFYHEVRNNSFVKECLHPDKSACSERIIKAHSIQNNGILSRISESGKVYMPCPKADDSFYELQHEYGRKEASIFTGFCQYHDKTVFQPIEDFPFSGTKEQIFLHVYRVFAFEYHRKKESRCMEQEAFRQRPSPKGIPDSINGKTVFELAVSDFEKEADIFNNILLTKSYDLLTSIVWEFDGFSNFAATGVEVPTHDFNGKKLQDLYDTNSPMNHIFYSVFPENGKTFAIIAWLSKNDTLFENIKKRLESTTIMERKSFINCTLPMYAENIAIRPSSWNKFSEKAKEEFAMFFYGIGDCLDMLDKPIDRFLARPTYDLFSC